MGKHSTRKLYFIFAAWTFLAVGIVAAVVTILEIEGIGTQAESDASVAVNRRLLPALGQEPGDLTGTELSTFIVAADGLLSDQVRTIRLWSADGELLAEVGAGQGAQADPQSVARAAEQGGTTRRASSPEGDVLASYVRFASGTVVEIQQDYDPIAGSMATSRWRLLLLTFIGTTVVLVLLQTVLWAATHGMRSEYDRLLYLYHTGQAIRSTLDLTDVMEQLARDAAMYTPSQLGMATLLEEGSNELVLKASFEAEENTVAQHHRKVEEWFLRRCAATGETVVAQQDRIPYRSMLGHEPAQQRASNILCVPIPGRERAIGVVTVIRTSDQGGFPASEVQMVEEMAAQGAMAVEQALLFTKMRRYAEEVELSYDGTLRVLMAALDTKDAVTQGHSERVSRLTVALAKEMKVPKERLVDVERGALLHDVGKIGVPDAVLRKPDSLNAKEWEAMQKHPLLAGLMVSKVGFLEGALPILLYHHERYDGSGYPFGLKGDAIPLEARIFTVIDAYDAMTSDRPYRKAMSHPAALEEIQRNAGIQFDPEVVEAFTRLMARYGTAEQRAA